jgi:EAL domain-containing protein (putative c-di-GMP-specific phosphodiesterase class I)
MLNALRGWFSRNDEAPEPRPACLVISPDPSVREQLSCRAGELGLAVEEFADAPAALKSISLRQPQLVFLDVAVGADHGIAIAGALTGGKLCGLQLVSTRGVSSYEQVCAVGQIRIAGDRQGLRVPQMMVPPFERNALRRLAQDLGLQQSGPGRPSVTLSQALQHNWLELWYQPKIHLHSKRLVGAEGLIRVRHPEHGVMGPASFLPGAGEADMQKMTEQVIIAALRDWETCVKNGVSLRLSVNAPVSALTTLPLGQMLREERPRDTSWPGLILEVTEDEIVHDLKVANDVADELRTHNCSLAIDDFGAGYSSFARLRQLPFSELKIDRSYVTDCNTDRTNAGLCETIVEMAHRFGLKTVAEGIETPHESHKLQGLGCNIGQGYLFAKPMALNQFVSLLRRGSQNAAQQTRNAALPGKPLPPLRLNARA